MNNKVKFSVKPEWYLVPVLSQQQNSIKDIKQVYLFGKQTYCGYFDDVDHNQQGFKNITITHVVDDNNNEQEIYSTKVELLEENIIYVE